MYNYSSGDARSAYPGNPYTEGGDAPLPNMPGDHLGAWSDGRPHTDGRMPYGNGRDARQERDRPPGKRPWLDRSPFPRAQNHMILNPLGKRQMPGRPFPSPDARYGAVGRAIDASLVSPGMSPETASPLVGRKFERDAFQGAPFSPNVQDVRLKEMSEKRAYGREASLGISVDGREGSSSADGLRAFESIKAGSSEGTWDRERQSRGKEGSLEGVESFPQDRELKDWNRGKADGVGGRGGGSMSLLTGPSGQEGLRDWAADRDSVLRAERSVRDGLRDSLKQSLRDESTGGSQDLERESSLDPLWTTESRLTSAREVMGQEWAVGFKSMERGEEASPRLKSGWNGRSSVSMVESDFSPRDFESVEAAGSGLKSSDLSALDSKERKDVSSAPSPPKRTRLGWGQGLAKYEKRKVGDTDEAAASGISSAVSQPEDCRVMSKSPSTGSEGAVVVPKAESDAGLAGGVQKSCSEPVVAAAAAVMSPMLSVSTSSLHVVHSSTVTLALNAVAATSPVDSKVVAVSGDGPEAAAAKGSASQMVLSSGSHSKDSRDGVASLATPNPTARGTQDSELVCGNVEEGQLSVSSHSAAQNGQVALQMGGREGNHEGEGQEENEAEVGGEAGMETEGGEEQRQEEKQGHAFRVADEGSGCACVDGEVSKFKWKDPEAQDSTAVLVKAAAGDDGDATENGCCQEALQERGGSCVPSAAVAAGGVGSCSGLEQIGEEEKRVMETDSKWQSEQERLESRAEKRECETNVAAQLASLTEGGSTEVRQEVEDGWQKMETAAEQTGVTEAGFRSASWGEVVTGGSEQGLPQLVAKGRHLEASEEEGERGSAKTCDVELGEEHQIVKGGGEELRKDSDGLGSGAAEACRARDGDLGGEAEKVGGEGQLRESDEEMVSAEWSKAQILFEMERVDGDIEALEQQLAAAEGSSDCEEEGMDDVSREVTQSEMELCEDGGGEDEESGEGEVEEAELTVVDKEEADSQWALEGGISESRRKKSITEEKGEESGQDVLKQEESARSYGEMAVEDGCVEVERKVEESCGKSEGERFEGEEGRVSQIEEMETEEEQGESVRGGMDARALLDPLSGSRVRSAHSSSFSPPADDLVLQILEQNQMKADEAEGKMLSCLLPGRSGSSSSRSNALVGIYSCPTRAPSWKSNEESFQKMLGTLTQQLAENLRSGMLTEKVLAMKYRAQMEFWRAEQVLSKCKVRRERSGGPPSSSFHSQAFALLSATPPSDAGMPLGITAPCESLEAAERSQGSAAMVALRHSHSSLSTASSGAEAAPVVATVAAAAAVSSGAAAHMPVAMRSMQRMPAMILGPAARDARRFISKNGLVEDPKALDAERKMINPWSPEEKRIFLDKYATYNKNFAMIASFLEQKTVADCVEFYYRNQKSEDFDRIRRRQQLKKRRDFTRAGSFMATTAAAASRNREAHAAAAAAALGVKGPGGSGVTGVRLRNNNLTRVVEVAVPALPAAGSHSGQAAEVAAVGEKEKVEKWRLASEQVSGCSEGAKAEGREEEAEEMVLWTETERQLLVEAVVSFETDFEMVSKHVSSKSREQCESYFSKMGRRLMAGRLNQKGPAAAEGLKVDSDGGREAAEEEKEAGKVLMEADSNKGVKEGGLQEQAEGDKAGMVEVQVEASMASLLVAAQEALAGDEEKELVRQEAEDTVVSSQAVEAAEGEAAALPIVAAKGGMSGAEGKADVWHRRDVELVASQEGEAAVELMELALVKQAEIVNGEMFPEEQQVGKEKRGREKQKGVGGSEGGKTRKETASWLPKEKKIFAEIVEKNGKDWNLLKEAIPGKTFRQIKTYFQNSKARLNLPTYALAARGKGGSNGASAPSSVTSTVGSKRKQEEAQLQDALSSKRSGIAPPNTASAVAAVGEAAASLSLHGQPSGAASATSRMAAEGHDSKAERLPFGIQQQTAVPSTVNPLHSLHSRVMSSAPPGSVPHPHATLAGASAALQMDGVKASSQQQQATMMALQEMMLHSYRSGALHPGSSPSLVAASNGPSAMAASPAFFFHHQPLLAHLPFANQSAMFPFAQSPHTALSNGLSPAVSMVQPLLDVSMSRPLSLEDGRKLNAADGSMKLLEEMAARHLSAMAAPRTPPLGQQQIGPSVSSGLPNLQPQSATPPMPSALQVEKKAAAPQADVKLFGKSLLAQPPAKPQAQSNNAEEGRVVAGAASAWRREGSVGAAREESGAGGVTFAAHVELRRLEQQGEGSGVVNFKDLLQDWGSAAEGCRSSLDLMSSGVVPQLQQGASCRGNLGMARASGEAAALGRGGFSLVQPNTGGGAGLAGSFVESMGLKSQAEQQRSSRASSSDAGVKEEYGGQKGVEEKGMFGSSVFGSSLIPPQSEVGAWGSAAALSRAAEYASVVASNSASGESSTFHQAGAAFSSATPFLDKLLMQRPRDQDLNGLNLGTVSGPIATPQEIGWRELWHGAPPHGQGVKDLEDVNASLLLRGQGGGVMHGSNHMGASHSPSSTGWMGGSLAPVQVLSEMPHRVTATLPSSHQHSQIEGSTQAIPNLSLRNLDDQNVDNGREPKQ